MSAGATQFTIGQKAIGGTAPCFIIAEAGSNHNGELKLALELVDAAAEAGADAVKFQTFEAKRLYPKSAGVSDYLGDPKSIYDIIKTMEMPEDWLPVLAQRVRGHGLAFISSPFHPEAVDLLDPFVDAFKIASYELTHHPLLEAVAAKGKPVIMSTGAADLAEVRRAIDVLRAAGCSGLVVLQCTAAYPAPPESINVRALVTLREQLGVLSGLSDHSLDAVTAPMAAAALGAAVIEKHYTLSKKMDGPDHAFAVEPEELAALVSGVRNVEQVLGSGDKQVHAVEGELREFARRSIFSTRKILAGEAFTAENVDVLRQGKLGSGLAPEFMPRVLGAVAAREIEAERPLTDDDLAV